jgi:hypothetical protein
MSGASGYFLRTDASRRSGRAIAAKIKFNHSLRAGRLPLPGRAISSRCDTLQTRASESTDLRRSIKHYAAVAIAERSSWVATSVPMISSSTRTRPRSSRCTRRQRVSANGPDNMRTFWPISRPSSRRTAPQFSHETTNASTTPSGTAMGCSAPIINEAMPNVPLTLRQRCLERSMITKI